jgi:hypothetical protein
MMISMTAIIGAVSIFGGLASKSNINELAEISVEQANTANRMESNFL